MGKIDEIYDTLLKIERDKKEGVSATDIAESIKLDRSNVSRYLNKLYKRKRLEKIDGRPVLYRSINIKDKERNNSRIDLLQENSLEKIVGAKQSLAVPIEKAKAAIMYPPRGLHTLLLGGTGVGKSMFAELMYQYAKEAQVIDKEAPFIRFNCADYVDNPNLLIAQIFGVKKGAYTGADRDKDGLLKQADRGILFLDEIHRLSPQGQEMLFTYIDNGFFRPLGETENLIYVNVRIIAATTEDPKSYLLQTFTRRIPMIITLPTLQERSLSERYSLIETFIKEESHRVGKSIYINKNSIISYLLYDCPNNIGQLRSDIQLGCAKAFLNYKSNTNSYLLINQGDLPNHVRKGILKIKEHRNEINELLSSTYDVLRFSQKEHQIQLNYEKETIGEDFYNVIEEKINSLKKIGMDDQDINEILNIDIESHFEKYIGAITQRFRKDEITSIVDNEILIVVEEILLLAQKNLEKDFDEKIYFALSLHLERSIERIKKGEKIYNPKLNFIRINHEEEFLFAMKAAKIIDSKFNIETPVDEIGYLAMFFAADSYRNDIEEELKVGVIVAMHGKSTASSMVEVANSLIGTEHVVSLDMPLTMKPQIMYEITKSKIQEIDKGRGVVMLVDMGSLTTFGDMIWEETGIEVRTIDMVSTPIVLDVCRKAIIGYSLDEIVDSFNKKSLYNRGKINKKIYKKNIIITACFTGEGSSKRIASIVRNKLNNKDIDILPMNILDKRSFKERIINLKEKYIILAIVGTVDIELEGIPFIPAIEILYNSVIEALNNIINEEEMYEKIGSSLKEHLVNIDGSIVSKEAKLLIRGIEKQLKVNVPLDVKMGITLHICFLIDNILSGVGLRKFDELEDFRNEYSYEMKLVKKCLKTVEVKYKISIGDNEIAYIVKLFIENDNSVQ